MLNLCGKIISNENKSVGKTTQNKITHYFTHYNLTKQIDNKIVG